MKGKIKKLSKQWVTEQVAERIKKHEKSSISHSYGAGFWLVIITLILLGTLFYNTGIINDRIAQLERTAVNDVWLETTGLGKQMLCFGSKFYGWEICTLTGYKEVCTKNKTVQKTVDVEEYCLSIYGKGCSINKIAVVCESKYTLDKEGFTDCLAQDTDGDGFIVINETIDTWKPCLEKHVPSCAVEGFGFTREDCMYNDRVITCEKPDKLCVDYLDGKAFDECLSNVEETECDEYMLVKK